MPTCTFLSGVALSGSVRDAAASLFYPVVKRIYRIPAETDTPCVSSLFRPLGAISVHGVAAALNAST